MTEYKPEYHKHISAKHNYLDLKLKEVWQYRDLILLFAKRNFTVNYRQTILGPLWFILTPIITSTAYLILFGNIAKLSTDGSPAFLFYLTGNAVWSFFAGCLTGNTSTFTSNAYLFGKVYFPRLTVPVSKILIEAVSFLIQMCMIAVLTVYCCLQGWIHPHWVLWLLIPLILIHLGLLGMGVGIMISSMTTKYRDLGILVGFGVTLWMYATPVVYPLSTLSEGLIKTLIMINPVSAPMELFRYAVLGNGTVTLWSLVLSWIFTALFSVFGIMIFNRVERNFMDTV